MDEEEQSESADKPKKKLMPILVGVVLALVLAGAGFFAVPILMPQGTVEAEAEEKTEVEATNAESDMVAFVPVPAMVVAVGPPAQGSHLRFSASLEVPKTAEQDVLHLMPRVSDALISFLQALETEDLQDRNALLRLRAQMLHRVRLVVGTEKVRDLLVGEFVMN